MIGDVPTVTAILDRFLHHAEVITITGKNYRQGNSAHRDKSHKGLPADKNDEKGKP